MAEHSLLSERSTQYGNSRSPSVYSQNCETGIARIPSDSAFTDNNIARSPCGTALNDSKIQSEELIIHNDVELADEVLDILGEGPQEKDKHSFVIHSALASRWNHILTNGISETEFSSLITKYKLPNNCDMLSPPVLNPETKTIIPQNIQKKDDAYIKFQTTLGTGIAALGMGIDNILSDSKNLPLTYKEVLLPCLSDAGRLLTNFFHDLSMARRSFIYPYMNKNTKELL